MDPKQLPDLITAIAIAAGVALEWCKFIKDNRKGKKKKRKK